MAHKTCKDKTKSKPHTENSVPSFIRKTYDILEEGRFPDIIDWNPEGTALVIKKPAEFCQKVLPAYFKHNNLTSFVRQLNMYNFHKRRTQNIDHVYSHELFQRGKKHLLKDIKRKNHDHSNDKTPKSTEGNEPSKKDIASLAYENQMLKRLYNEAMAKIAALEDQVKEATTQGQSLWSQISQSTGQENSTTPLSIRLDQQANIPQQSQIFQEVSIPPLRLDSDCSGILPSNPFAKNPSNLTTTCAPSLKEEVGESTATDGSHNSPSLHTAAETERGVDGTDAGRSLQISQVSQGGQTFQFRNELFISKKETSIGQLFESWSVENAEIMYFADQKLDRPLTNIQAIPHDVLGKRTLDQNADVKGFESEPSKRHELSIFRRKNLISTGTEEKDGMLAVTDDSEANMVVDLMNFSQPFC